MQSLFVVSSLRQAGGRNSGASLTISFTSCRSKWAALSEGLARYASNSILADANEVIGSVLLMPVKSADLACHVAELADACEVILHDDWL